MSAVIELEPGPDHKTAMAISRGSRTGHRTTRNGWKSLVNGGPLQRSLRKGLLAVQPFGKIVRALKKL
jgi:hypothetical protein